MKGGDWDNYNNTGQIRKYKREETLQGRINTLLEELLEKEEEIAVYKSRLKELETAFYYNLELISERDFELNILEKQLASENEELQVVVHEKAELEDLIKIADEKNNKRVQHLETKLSLKEKEIIDLQRENINNVNTLKRLLEEVKRQQEKQNSKMSIKFEIQKNELLKSYREEIEAKDKQYLLEIDNLAEKLEQACRERDQFAKAEEENKHLKYYLQDVEKHFVERENYYLEEIKKMSNPQAAKVSKGIQCRFEIQGAEKRIQAQPSFKAADCQTSWLVSDSEDEYIQKINFLQEQNEVLKYIVKDLKKNRDIEPKFQSPGQLPGCECLAIRTEIELVKKNFENEINNLKKILEEEQKQRAEEDAMIQRLEASVTCLKDKLVLGLQEKLEDFGGEDICCCKHDREIQNEIHVSLLEQTLSKKIDSLATTAEEERQKVQEKLEDLKKECIDTMEKYLKSREEPTEVKSDTLLEKIRLDIQKLENKIEADIKSMIKNNCEKKKCDKKLQTSIEFPETKIILHQKEFCPVSSRVLPTRFQDSSHARFEISNSENSRVPYYKTHLNPEKCISTLKCARKINSENRPKRKLGERSEFCTLSNNLLVKR